MKTSNPYPHVVLVDDEEYILEFMKSDLEANGFEVLAFTCPNEAVASLIGNTNAKGDEVDGFFLITDYRMPELSGLDMIDQLRGNNVKILSSILLTGLIPSDEIDRAMQMEDVEIMEKPVDIDQIVQKIKRLAYKRKVASGGVEAPLVE